MSAWYYVATIDADYHKRIIDAVLEFRARARVARRSLSPADTSHLWLPATGDAPRVELRLERFTGGHDVS